MESVWWLLKQIYDKKLMYKGYTIQPYSPKAGTAISSHELNQPGTYQDVSDTTVTAQFKLSTKNLPDFLKSDSDVFVLAWTTTPWTLPSNTALTVGPKIKYALVKSFNQYTGLRANYIVANDLITKQFSNIYFQAENEEDFNRYEFNPKEIPYVKVDTFLGKDLENLAYDQLLTYAKPHETPENAFRIILGDFVTTTDGTGIVHTAPTFGADDALVAKLANPPIPPMLVKDDNGDLVPLVDLQGRFRAEMGELAGKFVKNEYYEKSDAPEKSVDVEIAIKLKTENKAFKVEKYKHSYPNCWRTDKPILYYPIDSWFIKASSFRDKMVSLNKKINWKPKSTGEGRFEKWLENVNDWNLSRSRFWGIPLPIWRTEDGKEEVCIGSVNELITEINKSVAKGFMKKNIFSEFEINDLSDQNYSKIDLHKNVVDNIILVSPSGKKMTREEDLIDVWFDSGSMPYAQWHYPFENKEYIDTNNFYPADFIAEGVDQTRGWFYTLHAISTMVFDSISYKNVISNGLVLDKNGQKMSKRLGNAVDPFKTLSDFGPDATRWYMISNSNPWDNLKFDLSGVDEVKRKFFGTLYNTYSFFALYANIDNFRFKENEIKLNDKPELDRWIISELNTLIRNVENFYDDYEPTKAAREITNFVNDNLSNWYVRLSRRRFWKGEYELDKISAYQTLFTVLVDICKISAPISPFFMDKMFQDLTKNIEGNFQQSVHLEAFPEYDTSKIDKSLEEKVNYAQIISSLTLSLRAKEKIKVRQPLNRILIPVKSAAQKNLINSVSEEIKREVNIKNIEFIEGESDLLVKSIKPNFKKLGPKYGRYMKEISTQTNLLENDRILELEKTGKIDLIIDKKSVIFDLDDFDISSKDIEGWLVANEGNITVALDITIDQKLMDEGIAREIVSKIQTLRKSKGFEVTDRISLCFKGDSEIYKSIGNNIEYIKSETLANEIQFDCEGDQGLEVLFDKLKTKIFITKV
jgi:isoleucyl-tRNA synthetase